jgi:hypothetical protein
MLSDLQERLKSNVIPITEHQTVSMLVLSVVKSCR